MMINGHIKVIQDEYQSYMQVFDSISETTGAKTTYKRRKYLLDVNEAIFDDTATAQHAFTVFLIAINLDNLYKPLDSEYQVRSLKD